MSIKHFLFFHKDDTPNGLQADSLPKKTDYPSVLW